MPVLPGICNTSAGGSAPYSELPAHVREAMHSTDSRDSCDSMISCGSSSGSIASASNLDSDEAVQSTQSSRAASPLTVRYRTLMDRMKRRIDSGEIFVSLEFFPPRTPNGAANLISRMEKMGRGKPLFCDITWHPAGDPAADKPTSSITIAQTMLNYLSIETVLHMTCYKQTKAQLIQYLWKAKDLGLRNILALRGDPAPGESWKPQKNGLNYASDFVKLIRNEFGNFFIIPVAGYPHKHPDSSSYEEDLRHLKEKIDAGADFIISQLSFSAQYYLNFIKDCRRIGINCPILPGILPIQAYASLRHIVKLSGLDIPDDILNIIEPLKDNDEAIRNFGIDYAVQLCRELMDSGIVPGMHFYTLNRDVATTSILKRLGMWQDDPYRPLPWKPSVSSTRVGEDVRPIFWSMHEKSYVYRTSDWDEFPNGRWGNSSAASFGEFNHHLFYLRSKQSRADKLSMWGYLENETDVWKLFAMFLTGEPNSSGVQVTSLPWVDEGLRPESLIIKSDLVELNNRGFLTINSQPECNGVSSTHAQFGWGNPGGYIYQKAYLEFFCSKDRISVLLEILKEYPLVNYHIISNDGNINYSNCDPYQPVAVTWGVFPGKEILQPTVVDPIAFTFWKDEAFSMWLEDWLPIYEQDSVSRKVIQNVHDRYLLINLVDNDYPQGSCLFNLLDKVYKVCSKQRNVNSSKGNESEPKVLFETYPYGEDDAMSNNFNSETTTKSANANTIEDGTRDLKISQSQ